MGETRRTEERRGGGLVSGGAWVRACVGVCVGVGVHECVCVTEIDLNGIRVLV